MDVRKTECQDVEVAHFVSSGRQCSVKVQLHVQLLCCG